MYTGKSRKCGIRDGRKGKTIKFNGASGYSTVPMVLRKNGKPGVTYTCSTRSEPYNVAVMGLSCVANHHAPTALAIRSDGDRGNWSEGIYLAERVLNEEVDLHIWEDENEYASGNDHDSSDEACGSSDEEDSR